MKTKVLFSMFAVALMMFAGCGPEQNAAPSAPAQPAADSKEAAAPAKKTFKIAFSQCNSAEPYRTVQNNIFKQNEKKYEGAIELSIHDAQQDNAKQVNQIENIIQQGVDLIVMPSHRKASLFKRLMGQVSEKVMEEAKSPVLLVRH